MVIVFIVFLTTYIVLDYLTFYCFDIRTHTLVLLFILPLAFNFLLSRASLVDSHLLAHTLILLLISILLYFGKLLWKFVVQFLSFLIFMLFFYLFCFLFPLFSFWLTFSSSLSCKFFSHFLLSTNDVHLYITYIRF